MKRIRNYLILLFTVSILTGCLQSTTKVLPVVATSKKQSAEIIKSPNDKRDYSHLTLENGLKVLLISDPETEKSAATINVNVGDWSDPQGREGLAHFLEHMLLIQSQKYPEVDDYRKFVQDRGGYVNAFTANQNTKYLFEINADSLRPALDRLASSVAQPILSRNFVDKERKAVDSEFRTYFVTIQPPTGIDFRNSSLL